MKYISIELEPNVIFQFGVLTTGNGNGNDLQKNKIQIRFSFHSLEMQQALKFVQQIIQEKKSDSALDFDYCMNAM